MDTKSNFERARQLTETWPAWKRDYQLTKKSENQQPTEIKSKVTVEQAQDFRRKNVSYSF